MKLMILTAMMITTNLAFGATGGCGKRICDLPDPPPQPQVKLACKFEESSASFTITENAPSAGFATISDADGETQVRFTEIWNTESNGCLKVTIERRYQHPYFSYFLSASYLAGEPNTRCSGSLPTYYTGSYRGEMQKPKSISCQVLEETYE